MAKLANDDGEIDKQALERYLRMRRTGLTRRGIFYWVLERIQFGGVPIVGGRPLPDVDADDTEIGLPAWLEAVKEQS